MCRNEKIRMALPAYLDGSLDPEGRRRVDEHIITCAECADELRILLRLASEPVPDPGDAFWNTMPDRVYREIEHARRKPASRLDAFGSLLRPPFAMTAAALAAVALVSWILMRQVPLPVQPGPDTVSDAFALVEPSSSSMLDMAGMDEEEIGVVSQWADSEFKEIGEAALTAAAGESDIEDELVEMNPDQMDRLIKKLASIERKG